MPTRHSRYRSNPLPRNDNGLSLIEMVVAIAVVMVVLVSAGAAFVKVGEAQRSAEAADRVTQMVQDKLETIRKVDYSKVGCYSDDGTDPDTGRAVCPAKDFDSGEVVVVLGAARSGDESLGHAAPARETVRIGENEYTVKTVVTFAARPDHPLDKDVPTGYPGTEVGISTQAKAPYLAKRVRVTASWKLGAKTRTVTREWLRSPTSTEVVPRIPQMAGEDSGRRCALKTPFCTISITDGQVLQAVTFKASRPIRFTVLMSVHTTKATIKYGTTTQPLNADNGGVTNDGYTLTYVIPIGGSTGDVKPGANTVTVWADTKYGEWTATKDVSWRFPAAAAFPYQLANLHSVWDSSRATNTNLPPTGAEPALKWFCVKTSDKTLWRYTAVIFDEMNVDEMDGYKEPKLYATGMNPEFPSTGALLSQHPSSPIVSPPPLYTPGSTPVGGQVGIQKTPSGSLNQIRWSYGFQPGKEFPGTTSNIIISGERPADGAVVNASLTMPVYAVPDVNYCPTADTYAALKAFLTGAGAVNSQTNTLSWNLPAGVTYYKLYRVGTPVGTPDTMIYTGNKLTLQSSDTVPWGSMNSYYVVAYSGATMGPNSNTVTLTTGPGKSALSGTATGQTNALSWTAAPGATGATTYTLYRGGIAITPPGTSRTFNDTGRPWGSSSSYYVIAYNGIVSGPSSDTLTLPTPPAIPLTPTSAPTTSVAPGGAGFVVTCPTAPAGVAWVSIYRLGTTLAVKAQTAANTAWTDTTTITHTTSSTYYCTHGNASGESAKGPGATITGFAVVTAAPSAPTMTSMWGRKVDFSWPAVTGATSYKLTAVAYDSTVISTVTTTTTSVSLPTDRDVTATVTAVSAWGLDAVSAGTSVLMPRSMLTLNTRLDESLLGGYESRRASSLVSAGGAYIALLKDDGNFVVYSSTKVLIWATRTSSVTEQNMSLNFQGDGNLVLHQNTPTLRVPLRWTSTGYSPVRVDRVTMQDDSNLVVYGGATAWWSVGTPGQTFFR